MYSNWKLASSLSTYCILILQLASYINFVFCLFQLLRKEVEQQQEVDRVPGGWVQLEHASIVAGYA